jgi:HlyD family secretion protein
MKDKDGKLMMVMVRTGVSDTSYTEIVRSELKEGDVVLIGTLSADSSTTANNPRMGNVMFMGGPPGGGRR